MKPILKSEKSKKSKHKIRSFKSKWEKKILKQIWCVLRDLQIFDCMFLSCHVRISEWIYTHICLNVKEIIAQNRRDIWSLSDCDGTRTHNHLVRKGTLNYLAKLTKWLSCVVSTYLYGAFDCIMQSLFILFIHIS